jgi:hypothetical protein
MAKRVDRTELGKAERPNTVAGLLFKRAELLRAQKQLKADLDKVTCDLEHLDAAIRLFDPEQQPEAIKRYVLQYRARAGQMTRFLLDHLREAGGPVSIYVLAQGWIAERGMNEHGGTLAIIRRRIGVTLRKLVTRGMTRAVYENGRFVGYALVKEV